MSGLSPPSIVPRVLRVLISESGSQFSGDVEPQHIPPFWPGIGGGARKCPKLEALRVDLGEVSKTLHHTDRVCMKPLFAVVKMLHQVTRCVPDKWLRVNHQPGLSLGSQNISGVK